MSISNNNRYFFQKNKESYKHTFVIAYIMTGFAQVCELLFFYILYKEISVEQVGQYSLAIAIGLFFNVAINLGIEPILIRKFGRAELRLKQAVSAILIIRVPIVAVSALILNVVYWLHYLPYQSYIIISLVGSMQVLTIIESVYSSWLRAHHQQNTVNTINAFGSFGKLIFGFILIVFVMIR